MGALPVTLHLLDDFSLSKKIEGFFLGRKVPTEEFFDREQDA